MALIAPLDRQSEHLDRTLVSQHSLQADHFYSYCQIIFFQTRPIRSFSDYGLKSERGTSAFNCIK